MTAAVGVRAGGGARGVQGEAGGGGGAEQIGGGAAKANKMRCQWTNKNNTNTHKLLQLLLLLQLLFTPHRHRHPTLSPLLHTLLYVAAAP